MLKQPIIECQGISKSFSVRNAQIKVLDDLNLVVLPGQVVVIKGRSGTGKSVLMWLLAGLDRPDEGDVIFRGTRLSTLSNEKIASLRATDIAIIFQNLNLVSSWTAIENVSSVVENNTHNSLETNAISTAILTKLGLNERLNHFPNELSLGQQQRVAISRTIASKPSLIIADEPTGDVDPETAIGIINLLHSEVKERGATLIICTHGHFPHEHANQVLTLENGRLYAGEIKPSLEGRL